MSICTLFTTVSDILNKTGHHTSDPH